MAVPSVVDAVIFIKNMLNNSWIPAHTDGTTPTIDAIYFVPREVRALDTDLIFTYTLPASVRKQGIDFDFIYKVNPVSIDIRIGRGATGLSDDAVAIRQHAIKIRDEVRRIMFIYRKNPGGGWDELRFTRETDNSDRMRKLFRWVSDVELVAYAEKLPDAV